MKKGIIFVDRTKCVHCGGCAAVCQNNVILLRNEKELSTTQSMCRYCNSCRVFCPMGALKIRGSGYMELRYVTG